MFNISYMWLLFYLRIWKQTFKGIVIKKKVIKT